MNASKKPRVCACRTGLERGPDDAIRQCQEDIAICRATSDMRVLSPADPAELAAVVPWTRNTPKRLQQ